MKFLKSFLPIGFGFLLQPLMTCGYMAIPNSNYRADPSRTTSVGNLLLRTHRSQLFHSTISAPPKVDTTVVDEASPIVDTAIVADMSPARVLQKLVTGKQVVHSARSIQGTMDLGLNFLLSAPIFASFAHLWNRLFWGLHVRVAQTHGMVIASLFTSAIAWMTLSHLALAVLTIPEFVKIRQQQNRSSRKLTTRTTKSSTKQFLKTIAPLNFLTVFANEAIIGALPVILFTRRGQHLVSNRFSFGKSMLALLVFAMFADVSFFLIHRCMHRPNSKHAFVRWLSRIHNKVHHGVGGNKDSMVPAKAAHSHPVDLLLLGNLPLWLGPILMGAHPAMQLAFRNYAGIGAIALHSQSMPVDLGFHGHHHKHPHTNYGLVGFADRIAGTAHL